MTGRERFLMALSNGEPDRLPCQVHHWMHYYLKTYLNDCSQLQAYECFGMDPVLYVSPKFQFAERDKANWQIEYDTSRTDADGYSIWGYTVKTPKGNLRCRGASNQFTGWTTEHLIKSEGDFAIWDEFVPVPVAADWTEARDALAAIGERGITRGYPYDFGQGSPWQSLCTMMDIEPAIMAAIDKPQWVHHCLESMLHKKLRALEATGIVGDLVETGGGAGSNTVISPAMHEEFCVPYDTRQHAALHACGVKIVYHLCGGLMKMLPLVARNGADGIETMTPPSMGGDCDIVQAAAAVSHKLFFIGGFDQNAGFEKGTPALARAMVHELHAARPRGGYICCPSDHFFFGDPANIQAFADAAKECTY